MQEKRKTREKGRGEEKRDATIRKRTTAKGERREERRSIEEREI